MIIKILGSAAGGGFPQWNCNGFHSSKVRAGVAGYKARLQSSLAVSADGSNWVLLNASPDIRQQINETPELQPAKAGALRNSPIKAFAVPGKVALFLEKGDAGNNFGSRDGDTIGLKITDAKTGKSFFYIPGVAEIDPPLADKIRGADLIFLDGTLFVDDEMLTQGLLNKTGKRMGHISVSGPDGSISALRQLNVKRRIYVHINNSNPILDENSEARKVVDAAGWEVGFDGMEVRL